MKVIVFVYISGIIKVNDRLEVLMFSLKKKEK